MLNISIPQLEAIISRAVDAGIQKYAASLDPLSDRITKAEAFKYVVRLGYSKAQMKQWEEKGLLKGEKSGDSYNSPVYYSVAKIKELVCAIEAKRIINDNKVSA